MNSEELRKQASEEDNDLKALNILNKALREKRYEKFNQWYPLLKDKCISITFDERQFMFIIEHQKFGLIRFFPKVNKIFQVRKNKWIKPGLRWLVTNIINNA